MTVQLSPQVSRRFLGAFLPSFGPGIHERIKMPGRIAAFRELPEAMKQVTMLATIALAVSLVALIVAFGGRNGS